MTSVQACHHPDLSLPALIFGGVFIATAAICGAIEASPSSASVIEEVQVIQHEFAVGPDQPALVGMKCENESNQAGRHNSSGCLKSTIRPEKNRTTVSSDQAKSVSIN